MHETKAKTAEDCSSILIYDSKKRITSFPAETRLEAADCKQANNVVKFHSIQAGAAVKS